MKCKTMTEEKNLDEQPEETPSEKTFVEDETVMPASEVQALEINSLNELNPNMEVHHHGHVHEKKKWKEYVFQFLMLFLAVFCGFLAEYQLEHKIEKDREKQFITSLVADLQEDAKSLE